jgi:hypothetical protein
VAIYLELHTVDSYIMRCSIAISICWQIDRLARKEVVPRKFSPGFREPAPLRGCDLGSSLFFHATLGIRTSFLDYGLAVKHHLYITVYRPEIAPASSNLQRQALVVYQTSQELTAKDRILRFRSVFDIRVLLLSMQA